MASSKKKKEKKKDFQKAKLKVGKTAAKADNFTDTSFRAKAIVLGKQSISAQRSADTSTDQAARFAHHVSLLRHRSDTQRQESLAYLTTAIATTPPTTPLPEPVATLLPKLQPLLLDGTPAVRRQLLKLLHVLPAAEIPAHAEQLLLYARAAMTHLSADIRLFSMDVLDWLVAAAPDDAVAAAGAWVKTLRCFLGLLGWQAQAPAGAAPVGGWSVAAKTAGSRPGSEAKANAKYATSLAAFVRAGLVAVTRPRLERPQGVPLLWAPQYDLPRRANAFAHLNLFGPPRDEDNEILEDREDRQRIFALQFEGAVRAGMESMKREGGELGRAAAALRRAVEDGMTDYERDE
ncbi:hypothetical protein FH972_021179 [Carpinus fangiana]|uniref:Pre-rRNA-processing protein Ipi1 N-terminal domain-containing protein n=1 Tax=Carpinus fangiana TaxID=176857 RepID=A0A5N6KNN0_9ROSI|nr:hypothetical protein FH972_021179 [Carpinus fangiana]